MALEYDVDGKHVNGKVFKCTGKELLFLLFRSQSCPDCGQPLQKEKKYEVLSSREALAKYGIRPGSLRHYSHNHYKEVYYYEFSCPFCNKSRTIPEPLLKEEEFMAMKICPKCGGQNEAAASFCSSCGQAFLQVERSEIDSKPGRKFRKRMWIFAGTIVFVAAILALIFTLLGNAAELDYFKIGSDEVPTVKLVLGEERRINSVSTSTRDEIIRKTYKYQVDSGQRDEMFNYATYLSKQAGFYYMADYDFSGATGSGIQLGKNSAKDGYIVVVYIEYDTKSYTVELAYGEGSITPY